MISELLMRTHTLTWRCTYAETKFGSSFQKERRIAALYTTSIQVNFNLIHIFCYTSICKISNYRNYVQRIYSVKSGD